MRKIIDTNLLVRALVDEGTNESTAAFECLTTDTVFIPVTVLLETEWVLRSSYDVSRATVADLFGTLLGAENIEVEDYALIADAVVAHSQGFDFADALHLYRAKNCDALLTCDRAFIRKAESLSGNRTGPPSDKSES